ncbi:hypothetical protein HDU80_010812 [Chytriomyces hyalinus]|nr:hypothetical protein HDU80_010812 [Chytriomyces hyalinus]
MIYETALLMLMLALVSGFIFSASETLFQIILCFAFFAVGFCLGNLKQWATTQKEINSSRPMPNSIIELIQCVVQERDAASAENATLRRLLRVKDRAHLAQAMRGKPNKGGCYACTWTHTPLAAGLCSLINCFPVAMGPTAAVSPPLSQVSNLSSATPPATTPEPTPTQVALAAEADLISHQASVASAHPVTTTPSSPSSTATHNTKPNTPTPTRIATVKPAAPLTVKPSRVVSTVPRLPTLGTTPCKKPSPLGRKCVTAPSPPTSKITTTSAAFKLVTPNRKAVPKTPDVKVAAGMSGLINCSPAATRPSSLSRSPRLVAAPTTKSSPPSGEAAVAAESVPGLISWVSVATGASTASRLSETVAAKISAGQASKVRHSSPVQKDVSKRVNLIKRESPKTGGPSQVQRPLNGSPVAHPVAKPKREPSTLFSNPKLHKLLRNPGSRKEIKTSGALMYKQRPIRL